MIITDAIEKEGAKAPPRRRARVVVLGEFRDRKSVV